MRKDDLIKDVESYDPDARNRGVIGGEHSYNPNVKKWQDRVVIQNGKPKTDFKQYVKARMSREEIEAKRAQIKEEQELFDLEVTMLEEAKDLRDNVLAYLDETVTLDEFLEDMMNNGLCQRIGVWSNK